MASSIRRASRCITATFVLAAGCGADADATHVDSGAGSDAASPDGSTHEPDANIDADSPEACFASLKPRDGLPFNVQRFRGEDGKLVVWRARQRVDAPTVGETAAYELVRFWIESEEEPGSCVGSPSALSYVHAHHNWDETWTATTARARYTGREVFMNVTDITWEDTLQAEDLAGNRLWGPVALEGEGCTTEPYAYEPCIGRVRLDEVPSE